MRLLITGGCGFMGSNFIRYWLSQNPDDTITNLDKLTYAGNPENLQDLNSHPRYQFIRGDIIDAALVHQILPAVDIVVNFAAETHVDRSIQSPEAFIQTDILGTYTLLEAVKTQHKKLIQISTDEVYGSIETGVNSEVSGLFPGNPYSASKSGADLLCLAYKKTYQTPIVIARSCNVYGPYQYPEKLIPLFITNLLEKKKLPIYGNGLNIREWIYVTDFCRAVECIIQQGISGKIYNITSGIACTNLDITQLILNQMQQDDSVIEYVADRPGHDQRYAMDATKLRQLGWSAQYSLPQGIKETIAWYQEHPQWWQKIKSGDYKQYYRDQYHQE